MKAFLQGFGIELRNAMKEITAGQTTAHHPHLSLDSLSEPDQDLLYFSAAQKKIALRKNVQGKLYLKSMNGL
jgi:hypothetical protein